jgi:hypothetical protein
LNIPEVKTHIDRILSEEAARVDEAQRTSTPQSKQNVSRRIAPMVEALRTISNNNDDDFVRLTATLADKVKTLRDTKYAPEFRPLMRATEEVFRNDLSPADKKALDEALARELQRQKQLGGASGSPNPEVVFEVFMSELLEAGKK